ncbi:GPW/gp25 family protein [Desulfosediminicola flagellatus]|uniref:GPW/gp25 family protein n=1 Tax=Desulfosediminicola flagellatus TaxID=2569541 RepID=UPI0010AB85DE|nr:GPW/gp25 family protein [Desulfosediminicola flagellatus]
MSRDELKSDLKMLASGSFAQDRFADLNLGSCNFTDRTEHHTSETDRLIQQALAMHSSADKRQSSSGGKEHIDFLVCSGAENLQQAILARLMTTVGELTALGHPTYGSRLSSLIGMRDNAETRQRARLYVLEALAQDPRIERVSDVIVGSSGQGLGVLSISLSVIAVSHPGTIEVHTKIALE